MSFTSNELNYLVWRYLQESGFYHSAYVFGKETKIFDSSVSSVDVPTGSLVKIVQRGLYYIDAELRVNNNELPALNGDDCLISLLEGVVHLNPDSRVTMETVQVLSPPPQYAGTLDTGTPAGDENKQTISPSASIMNSNGSEPSRNPSLAVEMLRKYFADKRRRSGPLEYLPNLNMQNPSSPNPNNSANGVVE